MCFSFCLNKNELLLLAGFGLLYQGLDLDRKGKLIQDSQRLLCSVIEILDRHAAPGAAEFKKVACTMMSVGHFSKGARALDEGPMLRRKSDGNMPAPKTTPKSTRKQLQAFASRLTSNHSPSIKRESSFCDRQVTLPNVVNRSPTLYTRSDSQNSVSSVVSDPTHRHGHRRIPSTTTTPRQGSFCETPNLDYLAFNNEPTQASRFCGHVFKDPEPDLLTGFNQTQQLEAPSGHVCPPSDVISSYVSPSVPANYDWASELLAVPPELNNQAASANSVLSFSEEELTSGEELSTCDLPINYQVVAIPNVDGFGGLDGLDNNFAL